MKPTSKLCASVLSMLTMMWICSAGVSLANTYQFPATLASATQTHVTARYTNFQQRISFKAGGDKINVFREERRDPDYQWVWTEGNYSISGFLLDVAARDGGDKLYVAFMTDLGELHIEEWTFTVAVGQWIHVSSSTPSLPYAGVSKVKGGGQFVDPGRSGHVTPRRRNIFRGGTQVAELKVLEVDPEGRWLLMYEASLNLWSLPLNGPTPSATLLHDANSASDLVLMSAANVLDSANMGRIYLFSDRRNDVSVHPFHYTILADSDNDGIFDSLGSVDTEWMRHELDFNAANWTFIIEGGTEVP